MLREHLLPICLLGLWKETFSRIRAELRTLPSSTRITALGEQVDRWALTRAVGNPGARGNPLHV